MRTKLFHFFPRVSRKHFLWGSPTFYVMIIILSKHDKQFSFKRLSQGTITSADFLNSKWYSIKHHAKEIITLQRK